MTILDDVGEGVTLREVTDTIDEYGDVTESTSDSSITAGHIELLTADSEIVQSGILNVGDAVGYFKPANASLIKENNRVQHNNIWYVIDSVQQYLLGGVLQHIEASLKRVVV